MIKINMYGDGVRIWLCQVENELYNNMNKARNQLPWELVLFDLDFLSHFGFNHWSELAPTKEQLGFYLSDRNIIEIKRGNKRLSRFYASELLNQNSLFPLYKTVEKTINGSDSSSFILLEYETGLMMSYYLKSDKLEMDGLTFHISSIQNDRILSGISFLSTNLSVIATDTVFRRNFVLF